MLFNGHKTFVLALDTLSSSAGSQVLEGKMENYCIGFSERWWHGLYFSTYVKSYTRVCLSNFDHLLYFPNEKKLIYAGYCYCKHFLSCFKNNTIWSLVNLFYFLLNSQSMFGEVHITGKHLSSIIIQGKGAKISFFIHYMGLCRKC